MKLNTEWNTVTFGEVVRLEQGLCFNKKTNHLMVEVGIPLLRIADLINNNQVKFVDAEKVPKKFIAHPKDIIYSRTGQVGLVFKGRIGVVHNNCFRVIPQEGIEPDYVYWYLKQPSIIQRAKALAGGAAQPDLNHDAFKSITFKYPDLPTQRKIAGILSAYDDLIENNLRRIKILEEMAQSLYREWFVHFRFPGHESAQIVDSPLGQIPKGWEWRKVGEAFEIQGGGTPSTANEEYWVDGDIQWYSPRDLTAESTMFIEKSAAQINELGLKKSSAKIFPAYSVMLTSRATIGAIAINTVPSCTNQGFITCLPNAKVPLYFLHQWLKANVETFILHASGSTFKEISKGVFKSLDFLQPEAGLVQRYQQAVSTHADQLLNLQRRNHNLRQTRDLLLPKLLSSKDFNP